MDLDNIKIAYTKMANTKEKLNDILECRSLYSSNYEALVKKYNTAFDKFYDHKELFDVKLGDYLHNCCRILGNNWGVCVKLISVDNDYNSDLDFDRTANCTYKISLTNDIDFVHVCTIERPYTFATIHDLKREKCNFLTDQMEGAFNLNTQTITDEISARKNQQIKNLGWAAVEKNIQTYRFKKIANNVSQQSQLRQQIKDLQDEMQDIKDNGVNPFDL